MDDDELETMLCNELTCPHCKHVDHDSWELEDDDPSYECPNCGAEFGYERVIIVKYTSWRKEATNGSG